MEKTKCLIIGAGPAGYTAAISQAGLPLIRWLSKARNRADS